MGWVEAQSYPGIWGLCVNEPKPWYKQDGKFYAVKFMKKHEIIKLKQVDHSTQAFTLVFRDRSETTPHAYPGIGVRLSPGPAWIRFGPGLGPVIV